MASATGTSVSLQSKAYQGRYMKLTCTSSQDIANNKTNISWKLESIGGSSGHYATICRVYFSWYVNGTKNETCVYSIDKGYTYDAFPVTKGSTTGNISVPMDNDGNKTIYVDMDVAIFTSSTTRYSVQDGWKLNTVPRYPTISSFSVNKISGSSTSLSFEWSASAPGGNINKLEYSTDNGASFKTASSVTSPLTVSGLESAKGYTCKIRVTSSASGLTATSSGVYQTTYQQPTANISTANISGYNGLSQIKVNWSSNMTISRVGFSKDNGANYTYFDVNTTSGNYTFTGLAEGQSYNFKVQVKAATGSCVTTSGASSRAPYRRVSGKLYVNGTEVATNNGQTGVALKNGDTLKIDGISNGANCGYKLFFENPDNQHQYLSAKTTGTTAISMTAAQINERLQYFKNDPSQGFNVGLTTLNGSDQPALYYEFFGTISAVNVNPTFDENRWTYQDTNANTVALTGSNQILVNGFSKLRVSVNTAASGNGYATIKQYAVSGCTSGSSSTTGNIDCPNATNGGTIKVTAKDSRNNVTETTKTATFKDYFVPTLTSISATRSNGGVGTQTSMTFNGTWWNKNFGASANTLTAVYRYKSGSTWSDPRAITLTTSGNTYSFSTNQLYGDLNADGFTLGTTFTIEIIITDALNGGKSWTTVLNSGTPAIAISGSNVAVGAQYDTNKGGKLQVQGNANITGNLSIGGNTQFGAERYDLSDAGFEYDQYGNMKHKRSNNTDTFSIRSNANVGAVTINPETGSVVIKGDISTAGNVSSSKGTLNNQIDNTRLVPSVSTSNNSSYWVNVCKVKFSSHSQGEFCKVRLYIGSGNNGDTNQNAYIDIVMQLGWTGSVEGRAGVNAILYELNTAFKISNVSIKVIANSNIDYNIFIKPNVSYCRVNYVAHVSTNCNISNVGTTSTSTPTGTECKLSFVSSGLAAYPVNSIYMSIANTSPATFLGGTWERLPVSRYLYNSGGTSWSNSSITGTTTDSQGSHHHGSSAMKADIGFNWTSQNELVEKVRGTFTGGNKRMNNMPSYSEGSYSGSAVAVEGNTDDAGSHSHNIPYIAVFMWRRTA